MPFYKIFLELFIVNPKMCNLQHFTKILCSDIHQVYSTTATTFAIYFMPPLQHYWHFCMMFSLYSMSTALVLPTEYTKYWPSPLLDILLNKSYPAGLAWWQVGHPSVLLVQSSRECTPPYLSTGLLNLPSQPKQKSCKPALYVFSLLVSLPCTRCS